MKNICFFTCMLMALSLTSVAQNVGINTDGSDPDISAILDVKSTSKGLLIPRMTEVQRIAITSPATGLMVFQTDNTTGYYYYDLTWKMVGLSTSDHWSQNGTDIYFSSGNVGIGTNAPEGKLHVISGQTNAKFIFESNVPNGNPGLWLTATPPAGHAEIVCDRADVGGYAAFKLASGGSGRWSFFMPYSGDTDELNIGNAAGQNLMTFKQNGNIGVGTQTPQNKIDIEGGIVIGSAYSGTNTAPANGLLIEGFLGIGTTNPGKRLTVEGGSIRPASGNSEDAGIFFPTDIGGGTGDAAWMRYYVRSGESTTLEIGTSNDPEDNIALMPGGNLGIGVNDPSTKLDINGNSIRVRSASSPASNADGYTGEMRWDSNYIYICTNGDGPGGGTDTWKRSPLTGEY